MWNFITVTVLILVICENTRGQLRGSRGRDSYPGGFYMHGRYYSYRDPDTRSGTGSSGDLFETRRRLAWRGRGRGGSNVAVSFLVVLST